MRPSEPATVSVLIPSPGRAALLTSALESIAASTGVESDVTVVDTSPDGSLSGFEGGNVRVRTLPGGGFAAAINTAYRESQGEFAFITNDDVLVEPGYLAILVDAFRRHPGAALATGKILRLDAAAGPAVPRTLDSAGLVIGRNRRVSDRGAGLDDVGQFEGEEQVFGASGAAALGRREALDVALLDGELLDEDFFMYKEDCDLSWRLRLLGFECWYVPRAVAHHARTSRAPAGGYLKAATAFHRGESAKPEYVRFHSLKNQWLMLLKNEDAANLLRDAPFVAGRELLVLGSNLLRSPKSLAGSVRQAARLAPRARAKRREIKRRQVARPEELRRRWLR